MNANKRLKPMIILAGALLACLAFSAQAGEHGGVEASTTTAAGGGLRRPDGEETAVIGGSSSKIYVVLCVKTTCGDDPLYDPICYCCQTLTHKPCYMHQQDCLRQCPHRQLPARSLGADSIVVD